MNRFDKQEINFNNTNTTNQCTFYDKYDLYSDSYCSTCNQDNINNKKLLIHVTILYVIIYTTYLVYHHYLKSKITNIKNKVCNKYEQYTSELTDLIEEAIEHTEHVRTYNEKVEKIEWKNILQTEIIKSSDSNYNTNDGEFTDITDIDTDLEITDTNIDTEIS